MFSLFDVNGKVLELCEECQPTRHRAEFCVLLPTERHTHGKTAKTEKSKISKTICDTALSQIWGLEMDFGPKN